jgi:hypothetical protein
MSIKTLIKTRWKIGDDKLTIYPFGRLFIFGIVLGIIFLALIFAVNATGIPYIIPFLITFSLVMFAGGYTCIVFDRQTNTMKKLVFGIIPVTTKPFDQLYGVNIMRQATGGFNYRIYPKDNKFGRGTIISSYYGKDTDPYAIAFNQEVVTRIHSYLDQADPLPPQQEIITEYQYFTESQGIYTLKQPKAGSTILGLILLAFAIHEMLPTAWMIEKGPLVQYGIAIFSLLLAVVFLNAIFMTITFDTRLRIVQKTSPLKMGNLKMPFEYFVNFHMVRKSTNGAYTGTEVYMIFQVPDAKHTKSMLIQHVRNTKKIDRLIEEVKNIMR